MPSGTPSIPSSLKQTNASTSDTLPAEQLQWFQQQLWQWGRENFRDFPWRHTQDPYRILVAECLLQKTTALQAERTYQTFLQRYPTAIALAQADEAELVALVKPLGMSFRAGRLLAAAQAIVEHHNGQVPADEAALLALPGVGLYVARSILANAFGQPVAVLDRNVARILERVFGVEGGRVKTRDRGLWQLAQQVAPQEQVSRWNLTLIDFGAAVCTNRNPNCPTCPLNQPSNWRCCWAEQTAAHA